MIRLTIQSPDEEIESVAALANLAVNDDNEVAIDWVVWPILDCARSRNSELVSQACRALRNLSVCSNNRKIILQNDGVDLLEELANNKDDRIRAQAGEALTNLGFTTTGGRGAVCVVINFFR